MMNRFLSALPAGLMQRMQQNQSGGAMGQAGSAMGMSQGAPAPGAMGQAMAGLQGAAQGAPSMGAPAPSPSPMMGSLISAAQNMRSNISQAQPGAQRFEGPSTVMPAPTSNPQPGAQRFQGPSTVMGQPKGMPGGGGRVGGSPGNAGSTIANVARRASERFGGTGGMASHPQPANIMRQQEGGSGMPRMMAPGRMGLGG